MKEIKGGFANDKIHSSCRIYIISSSSISNNVGNSNIYTDSRAKEVDLETNED